MDIDTIHRNADRVAGIFNALATFVLIIGGISAVLVLIGGFVNTGSDSYISSVISGIVAALIIAVYTAITWAGVQLAALIAGYVKVRTGPGTPQG